MEKNVFVVYGRNGRAHDALVNFLRALKLNPLEWTEAMSFTESRSPYNQDVVSSGFAKARAIVILLTGDDVVRLRQGFLRPDDPEIERRFARQPRPNVFFEAGMALARHPNNTILVSIGKSKPFSDIAGRHILELDDSLQMRQALVSKLKRAGCDVQDDHSSEWLTKEKFGFPEDNLLFDELKNSRGFTLAESCMDSGLVDIETRDNALHHLPPMEFYEGAQNEVAVSGLTLFQTFHQHIDLVTSLLDKGRSLRFLLLDPDASETTRLSIQEKPDIKREVEGTLDLIRRSGLHQHPAFRIRTLPRLPPYTGVMRDGDIEHDPAFTKAPPRDDSGEIRVQPSSWASTQHKGVVIQLRKKNSTGPGAFEYFAQDLRRQWTDSSDCSRYFSG